MRMSKLFAAKK